MIKQAALIAILSASSLLLAGKGKKDAPPSDAELAAITQRGKMLAEYDIAAWHATDVFQDLKPESGSTRYFVAQKSAAGWVVVFGRLSDVHDKFLIVYEAMQGTGPEFFTIKKYDPPRESADFFFCAAKGFETALKDFQGATRPYNVYAFPSETGQLYVYVLPASAKDGVYLLGGDARYTFTADGNTLLEKRQMHKTILEFDANEAEKKGNKTEAGFHTHILSALPEDSDVFYVLSRKPSISEYVGSPDKHVYEVQTDGSIRRVK